MRVALAGAGAGAAAALVELANRGIAVRIWNRTAKTLAPIAAAGGVHYEGVFGTGFARAECISTNLAEVLDGAEAVLVCVPTLAHAGVAAALAEAGVADLPVVLNPGHTGGALEVREVFRTRGLPVPPLAEFSTLAHVARKPAADRVSITGAARRLRLAPLPGGRRAAEYAAELFPAARAEPDVLATGLANVNMVLHPPGAVLGAAWVEATRGDFTFYVQGLTDGVGRVMEALDRERQAVAAAFGHDLPGLFHEMQAIGTIEAGADPAAGLAAGVRGGEANRRIRAPDSLAHRYYLEDFFYGVKPFLALARIARVETPVAEALMTVAETLTGAPVEGRSAERMGIAGMDRNALLALVRP
jgi:opine dehydrogenase